MTLRGSRPDLNKVRLTQTVRGGGNSLRFAVSVTESVLAGRRVRVHLGQFASIEAAAEALTDIGILEIRGEHTSP